MALLVVTMYISPFTKKRKKSSAEEDFRVFRISK
jgi:hypothetical protein